jgi:hypothetical protein
VRPEPGERPGLPLGPPEPFDAPITGTGRRVEDLHRDPATSTAVPGDPDRRAPAPAQRPFESQVGRQVGRASRSWIVHDANLGVVVTAVTGEPDPGAGPGRLA